MCLPVARQVEKIHFYYFDSLGNPCRAQRIPQFLWAATFGPDRLIGNASELIKKAHCVYCLYCLFTLP